MGVYYRQLKKSKQNRHTVNRKEVNKMTKKQYKHSANVGYMRYYHMARRVNSVHGYLRQELKLEGYLEGIRNLATEDMDISYEEFDEILTYCRMLEDRFEEKFDL